MEDVKKNSQALLLFHSSGIDCAFPLEAVREIVPMAVLSSPPGLPSGVEGFLNLRGDAVPVLRLDRLFNLAAQEPGLYTPIVMLRGSPASAGILVESVLRIVPAGAGSLLALPDNNVFRDCAISSVNIDGLLVYLLSPAGILLENERRSLADFWAMAQERAGHLERRR